MWAESSSGFDMSMSLPCPRRRRLWIMQVSVHIPSESAGGSFTSYSYSPLMFDRKSVVNLSLQVSTTIWATSYTVCVCVMSSKNTMWAGRRSSVVTSEISVTADSITVIACSEFTVTVLRSLWLCVLITHLKKNKHALSQPGDESQATVLRSMCLRVPSSQWLF